VGIPNFAPIAAFDLAQSFVNLDLESGDTAARGHSTSCTLCRDREPPAPAGRCCHLGEVGPLAAQQLLHVSPPLRLAPAKKYTYLLMVSLAV